MGRRVKGQFVITGHSYLVWLLSSGSPVLTSSDWKCNEIAVAFCYIATRGRGLLCFAPQLVNYYIFYHVWWIKLCVTFMFKLVILLTNVIEFYLSFNDQINSAYKQNQYNAAYTTKLHFWQLTSDNADSRFPAILDYGRPITIASYCPWNCFRNISTSIS